MNVSPVFLRGKSKAMVQLPSISFGAYTKLTVHLPNTCTSPSQYPLVDLDSLCYENEMSGSGYVVGLLADHFTNTTEGKALAKQLSLQRTPTQDNIGFMGIEEGFFLTDKEYDVWIKDYNDAQTSVKRHRVATATPNGLDNLQERYKPEGLLQVSLKWDNPTSSTKKLVLDKVSFDTNA